MPDVVRTDRPSRISKAVSFPVTPHLLDRRATCATFRWSDARRQLAGLPGGGLNIAAEAVERHALGSRAGHPAIVWLGADGARQSITYADLHRRSNCFANAISALGIKRGDRLFILAPRIPALYVAALGALKAGVVVSPLFSAFGPEPIATRMNLGGGCALVTTAALYARKVAPVRAEIPTLAHVLVAGGDGGAALPPGGHDLDALLDLHPDDVFWCTADPGWVTGMSYGIIAPLVHGVTMVVDEAEFDPERWYRILQDERVSVWYTAPTAVRMLMKAGDDIARNFAFPKLRFIASVGEPLNPQAVWWGQDVFGLPIHDNWWQTETGGIMVANTVAQDIKPGSMGLPLPGIEAFVVQRRDGGVEVVEQPDVEGELALRAGWPSMFRGYLNDEERYRKCFAGDLYLTGDLVKRDADGYYWFVGRADDVIKSAGHLIGPFEVESALMEHPAVAEAGVIGKPDPVLGETVKAFVSLKSGFTAGEELRRELLGHARKRLGPTVAPKEIDFTPKLPRTRSGKIMRRLLKARELGLPEGDTSTLEADR